jgi:small subunit ribosomal protein S13
MARIAGVEIPDNKVLKVSLTYIFGVGDTVAKKMIEDLKLDPETKVKDLSDAQLTQLRSYVDENVVVEGHLRQQIFRNIKRLIDIRSYRGIRHKIGMPVRGQRTRVNARTRKGKSQAVGGLKMKVTKT